MRDFRKYGVWNDAISLVTDIYNYLKGFPAYERYALSDQMRRSAVSIAANIAEGASRTSSREFIHFLEISIGSAFELETQRGQDFRVDYLFIGDFIKQLQVKKHLTDPIPVSCFTATAKQKVISDIRDYFKRKLDIDLRLFASTTDRQNLHYAVIHADTEDEKYNFMRNLLIAIVYCKRNESERD